MIVNVVCLFITINHGPGLHQTMPKSAKNVNVMDWLIRVSMMIQSNRDVVLIVNEIQTDQTVNSVRLVFIGMRRESVYPVHVMLMAQNRLNVMLKVNVSVIMALKEGCSTFQELDNFKNVENFSKTYKA